MAVDIRAGQLAAVHAEDGKHEADQAMLEEGDVEQPLEEPWSVHVAQEEAGENRERHDEEWTEDYGALKVKIDWISKNIVK